MCPFKAGDVVCFEECCYWFINDDQYVLIGVYERSYPEGKHKGLYLANDATKLDWYQYKKVCTIDELRKAIMQVQL